jgi:asparagine synthase (glutamine-hydrolysing)
VAFYLRRMDLVRRFQITPCFPMLDHRLVQYAARIPSRLKLRGLSGTKYIQHLAMKDWLPEQIVTRKDKLGHSVPFKNWLRDEPVVQQFVHEILFSRKLRERAIINNDYVRSLWNDHQERRRNNSHRLWSLAVLELWLSANNL